jgi:hypothetical protein
MSSSDKNKPLTVPSGAHISPKIQYSNVDSDKLEKRKKNTDFDGNLTEFQLTFNWKWISDDTRLLYEGEEPYSGTITIKDSRLDEMTYPGQGQIITVNAGKIEFYKSLKNKDLEEKLEAERAYAELQAQIASGIAPD